MKSEIEGPNEGMFKPPSDKLPTKHYPETTDMAKKGPKVDIEGPCEGKKGY